ncbi:M18 family aminopeptidase [Natronospora cellulosivora (SeqCode)]
MINEKNMGNNLLDFINRSPSAFHAVESSVKMLRKAGFKDLDNGDNWYLKKGGKYFLTRNQSALIAFIIGTGNLRQEGFRLIASHTDSPGFRIKPAPEMIQDKYLKLNTEVYGGPILNTWLDRPLSIAGRLSLRSGNPLKPKIELVNFDRPILNIPNLAIHLNPKVNQGIELNKQKHLLPIVSMIEEEFNKNNFIKELISQEKGIKQEDILDFDLFLYEYEKGCISGLNNEFISSSRLDDLAMVYSSLSSLVNADQNQSTRVVVLFDNEEIGSKTKQGADSPFLRNALERISLSIGYSREEFFSALANSFMISADMAHAVHPNYIEKHDPSNKNYLNCGPVVKISANQKYTSDSESIAIFKELCRKADIPYQTFVNRSDQRGGSTIGPVSAGQIDIKSVDIGNPLLAMHSIRELIGLKDCIYIKKLFDEFYNF